VEQTTKTLQTIRTAGRPLDVLVAHSPRGTGIGQSPREGAGLLIVEGRFTPSDSFSVPSQTLKVREICALSILGHREASVYGAFKQIEFLLQDSSPMGG
jgi:hypothetical protein